MSKKHIATRELNIMFTCAGRRVRLLDAFRRAQKTVGVTGKIVATDVTSASAAFIKADVGVVVPSVGMIHYVKTLMEIVTKHKIGLLVPLTDLDIRVLSRHRDRFAEVGCTVMVGSEQSIMTCRDKVKTNSLLSKGGLAPIATCTLKEFYEKPFYPCFVKPVRGSAGVGTGLIRNERQLRGHAATFGEMLIVQEYVPGQEFTVDVYRSRDGQVRCLVPRQRLSVRSGEVEKGITVKDEELMRTAGTLACMLGDIWGVFCCQCRREEGRRPRFFEVNPRFGGGSVLSIAAGADLPLYLLQEVLGLPITAKPGQFTENLLMLRFDDAVFVPVTEPKTLPGYDTPSFR